MGEVTSQEIFRETKCFSLVDPVEWVAAQMMGHDVYLTTREMPQSRNCTHYSHGKHEAEKLRDAYYGKD